MFNDSPNFNAQTPLEEAQDMLRWALDTYPDILMPSAFNINGTVLIDLAAKAGYRGEVVFVDTGYHFLETLQTRDAMALLYPQLSFVTISAHEPDNKLFEKDIDACCFARKVRPLREYLDHKAPSALLSARCKEQSDTRQHISFVDTGGARPKINPLINWTRHELEAYAAQHNLPVNPLYAEGYLSIGCAPCTRPVAEGEDWRAGRWAGKEKTECGLWQGKAAL